MSVQMVLWFVFFVHDAKPQIKYNPQIIRDGF